MSSESPRRAVLEPLERRRLLAAVPSGFADATVVTGVSNPTSMAFAPDGRLFVTQQNGQVRVVRNGQLLAAPFTAVTTETLGERGLLGLAFDPAFSTTRHVYVYYTVPSTPRHNRVSRFTAGVNGDGSIADTAVAGSEVVVLELDNLTNANNHNGGALHFGPDGKLYVAVGDNATPANAQSLSTRHGKVLRINKDGSIPSDNPFFTSTTGANRAIWAMGLRNPFTFAFRPGSSKMFINDVGQSSFEEVNDGAAGRNYGWPQTEGFFSQAQFPNFTNPTFAYARDQGIAITGSAFYNPAQPQFPSGYVGDYFYADFGGGWVRKLDAANNASAGFATGLSQPVDIDVAPDGSLYYLERGNGGRVGRVRYTIDLAPDITQHPASQTVTVGATAHFAVGAVGEQPLTYQWQRNGVNIPGATAATYQRTNAQLGDSGARFRAVVSNIHGTATSDEATLTVTSNRAPTGTITAPLAGARYEGGQTISYAGTATDPEDGTLPASAFTWRVDFHHDTHFHPFIPSTTGSRSGSFSIARLGETSANVFYRIHLTVRDAGGLTHGTFRDVLPRTSTVTLATNVPGLSLNLDGQPRPAPHVFSGVVGITRTLGAPATQTLGNATYRFVSWSDGGAATHNVNTPATNTTYTAAYELAQTGAVVDVEAAPVGPIPSGVYAEDGFTFTNLPGVGNGTTETLQVYGSPQGYASKVLHPTNWGRRIAVAKADGAPFSLQSFDYAAGRHNDAGDLTVTGRFAGGGTQTRTASYSSKQFATLSLNWQNLVAVDVNFAGGVNAAYGALDNFRFGSGAAYLFNAGRVVMEAEAFDARLDAGGHTWQQVSGGVGGSAVQASPDTGVNVGDNLAAAPRLDYRVNFPAAGTYYVWVRGRGIAGQLGTSDSVHVGLNGSAGATSRHMTGFGESFSWTGRTADFQRARITVGSAGVHTVNLWMREDGVTIDRLLLTGDVAYTPSGDGPPASNRG